MKVDNFHFFFLRSSVPVVSHHLGWAGRDGAGQDAAVRGGAERGGVGQGGAGRHGVDVSFDFQHECPSPALREHSLLGGLRSRSGLKEWTESWQF